jgi:hypothetical protein
MDYTERLNALGLEQRSSAHDAGVSNDKNRGPELER